MDFSIVVVPSAPDFDFSVGVGVSDFTVNVAIGGSEAAGVGPIIDSFPILNPLLSTTNLVLGGSHRAPISELITLLDNEYEPINANIQQHISDTSNPHSVTYTQVGADAAGTAQSLVNGVDQSKWEPMPDITTTSIKYGRLYNWYAATDSRGIAPIGWHVPSATELQTLLTQVGNDVNKLKDIGNEFWIDGNNGTNDSQMSIRGASHGYSGMFDGLREITDILSTTTYDVNPTHAYQLFIDFTDASYPVLDTKIDKTYGCSIRLIKDNSINEGDVIIDGDTYNAVTIGTQVWLQQNLAATHYQNGDLIGTDFSGVLGAVCAYNNDELNVYSTVATPDATHIQPKLSKQIYITAVDGLQTDLDSKVDKITGSSLVADTEIAKIHAPHSDDQDLSGYQLLTEKNANNGYAPLDAGGKVPVANLPNTLLKYKSTWNATTNTPTLSNNQPTQAGEVYIVSVAGTQFSITWKSGDWLVYNDLGVIEISPNSDEVVSVNGQVGIVSLTKSDVGLGNVDNTADANKTVSKANHMKGGNSTTLKGAIGYQSDVDTTTLLSPNITTTKKFLRETGDGTNGTVPVWDTIVGTDLANADIIAKLLTGFSAASGTVAATDSILAAFNKVVGNIALKANIASPAFTGLASAPNFIEGFRTQATAGTTTTLVYTDTYQQYFTGTSIQTVLLPTTSVVAGQQFLLVNLSTGLVTIQSSGANTIVIMPSNTSVIVTALVATPTTAANWNYTGISSELIPGSLAIANTTEAAAGIDDTKAMTPLKTFASYELNYAKYNGSLSNLDMGAFGAYLGFLRLAAGSATAGTAPIKLTSGALNTVAEVGAIEFLTDAYYGTITNGAIRRMFVQSQTGRSVAQTAAVASVLAYTPVADASYQICANVLVTTSSAEAFTVTCTYTDEGNTARTATLNFQRVAGTIGTAIAAANGAVPYMGIPLNIRCKANTAITMATTGTFTGCTYNVEAFFKKIG